MENLEITIKDDMKSN